MGKIQILSDLAFTEHWDMKKIFLSSLRRSGLNQTG
jgi:hypothetical protein